ncbi:MAG: hypothetical protein H7Y41_05950 [Hyphomonadaceae bacterium]|nr:hypothetical protein [Clostridia bacterium]
MKALQIGSSSPVSSKSSVATPTAVPYRTGDVVVVQAMKVQEVSNNMSMVMLRFPNGDTVTTNFLERFAGKAGDTFPIKIQSKTDKQVFAEIIRNQDGIHLKQNGIINLLSTLNIANTPENYQIAMQMIKNDFTKSKESFQSIVQLIAQHPDLTMDQIVFMVKKDIPLNAQTTASLNAMIAHEGLIGEQLLLLFQSFMENDEKSETLLTLLKGFYKNPENKDFEAHQLKSEKTMIDLVKILLAVKSQNALGENTDSKIAQFSQKAQTQFEVMQTLNATISYLQIPLNTNGYFGTGELYLLNDEKMSNDAMQQWSLFLRIPTAHLGLIELFIHVDSNKSFQCHLNTAQTIDMKDIHSNVMKLYESMGEIGYHLVKMTYNQIPPGISLDNFQTYAELIRAEKKFDERI